MSVIYDALKKLKSSSGAKTPGMDAKPRVIGNIFTFPLLYLSPGGLLMIMLIVLLASGIFVLGINYFRQFLPGETGLVRVVRQQDAGDTVDKRQPTKQPEEKQHVDSDLHSGKEDVFKNIPAETPREISMLEKTGVLKAQPRFIPRAISPNNKQPVSAFRPVASSASAGENARQSVRQTIQRNSRPTSIRSVSTETITDYRQTPPEVIENGITKITPAKLSHRAEIGNTEHLHDLSPTARKPLHDDGHDHGHLHMQTEASTLAVKSEPLAVTASPADVNENPAKPVAAEKDTVQTGNIKKKARLSALVAKLEKTMLSNRNENVEDYLEELTRLKGVDDAYVLKMKAFWHMSRNEYELATDMLSDVLAENKNDIEAGINMAILEIKTDRVKEARKRLSRLKGLYPNNTVIQRLQKKILR